MASSKIKFLTTEEVSKRFSVAQRKCWPTQYRPTYTVAHYIRHSVTESSSAYPPATLAKLIDARKSLQSQSARAAAAGPDDGSAAAVSKQPMLSTPEMEEAAKKHDFSLLSAGSMLGKELPRNQKVHLEAAFLDFMDGRDEVWLSEMYDGVEGDISRLMGISGLSPDSGGGGENNKNKKSSGGKTKPRLPWKPLSLSRRHRFLKKVTARERPTLPSFVEMCEFLNLPLPCDAANSSSVGGGGVGPSGPINPQGGRGARAIVSEEELPAEERLERYLRSVPEELRCEVEITDFRKKGNRLSPAAGTVGVKMGSDPSRAPEPVNIAPVDTSAQVGTYRHSVEAVVKVYERDRARAERAAKTQKKLSSDDTAGGSSAATSSGSNAGEAEETPSSLPLSTPPHFYSFTPYAAQQERALQPLSECGSLDDNVLLPTFSQLRDLLYMDYFNSFGVANYLCSLTGDGLVLTAEFVTELAMYLARRWHEIAAKMSSDHAVKKVHTSSCPKPGPILLPLGNGRLAYHLNESGILPTKCYATSRHSEIFLYPAILGSVTSMDESKRKEKGFGYMPYPFPSAFYNTSTVKYRQVVSNAPLSPSSSRGGAAEDETSSKVDPFGMGAGKVKDYTGMSMDEILSSGSRPQNTGGMRSSSNNTNNTRNKASNREGEEEDGSGDGGDDGESYLDLPPIPGVDPSAAQQSFSSSSSSYAFHSSGANGGESNNKNAPQYESNPLHPSFYESRYPIATEVSVSDALHIYRPSIVIAEPHTARDYGADMRGCPSVQEVVFIGPIDSPAMGSFSFPWLTFGVSPGPDTYNLYNDQFQLQGRGGSGRGGGGGGMMGGGRMQMPMDPPYMAQGYQRVYLDRISSLTILPNDSAEVPRQGRCLSFRRV